MQAAQQAEHRVGGALAHIELDGVAVGPARHPAQDHDVSHPWLGVQRLQQAARRVRRAHHAHAQHRLPTFQPGEHHRAALPRQEHAGHAGTAVAVVASSGRPGGMTARALTLASTATAQV